MLNEISKNLHVAKVIDNNNSSKDGSVKIFIPYMHEGIKNDFLPDALPFTNFLGGSSNFGISIIPENDSFIWVFFEDEELQRNPFYIGNVNNEDVNPQQLFDNNVKSNVGADGNYPDVKFLYTKNGICLGITTTDNNAEIFIHHPNNSYIFINKDGEIELKSGSGNLESSILGETLKEKLDEILDAIMAITVTVDGSPTPINNIAQFSDIKLLISEILSPKIKNN